MPNQTATNDANLRQLDDFFSRHQGPLVLGVGGGGLALLSLAIGPQALLALIMGGGAIVYGIYQDQFEKWFSAHPLSIFAAFAGMFAAGPLGIFAGAMAGYYVDRRVIQITDKVTEIADTAKQVADTAAGAAQQVAGAAAAPLRLAQDAGHAVVNAGTGLLGTLNELLAADADDETDDEDEDARSEDSFVTAVSEQNDDGLVNNLLQRVGGLFFPMPDEDYDDNESVYADAPEADETGRPVARLS